MRYICIDIGNTRSKIGVFSFQKLQNLYAIETPFLQEKMQEILSFYPENIAIKVAYISTSQEMELEKWAIWQAFSVQITKIDAHFAFPIKNQYATPLTLGTDRIVNVIAALRLAKGKNVLVISVGTAIIYDFADAKQHYWGGAISLGLKMRFRALYEFTARLPLITELKHVPLVGNSTQNSILSGVINGTIAEIRATIQDYQHTYGEDIALFLTGGDAVFLAEKMQDIPFHIAETLTLKGIFALIGEN